MEEGRTTDNVPPLKSLSELALFRTIRAAERQSARAVAVWLLPKNRRRLCREEEWGSRDVESSGLYKCACSQLSAPARTMTVSVIGRRRSREVHRCAFVAVPAASIVAFVYVQVILARL